MSPCGNESCCTRPVLSSFLTALTLAAFAGAICFLFLGGREEKCDCEDDQCCTESTSEDPCGSDECYCPFNIFFGNDICRKRDTELTGARLAVFFVLIAIGIGLIVASSISCCCRAKTKNNVYQGSPAPVLQGIPTVEMTKA